MCIQRVTALLTASNQEVTFSETKKVAHDSQVARAKENLMSQQVPTNRLKLLDPRLTTVCIRISGLLPADQDSYFLSFI